MIMLEKVNIMEKVNSFGEPCVYEKIARLNSNLLRVVQVEIQ